MTYISKSDIEDELLIDLISDSDIAAAQDAVNQLAFDLDIDQGEIKTNPLNYKVKKFALAVACENRAKMKAGTNPLSHQGGDGIDAYEIKRKTYASEVSQLAGEITPYMLTGKKPGISSDDNVGLFHITLGRG